MNWKEKMRPTFRTNLSNEMRGEQTLRFTWRLELESKYKEWNMEVSVVQYARLEVEKDM